MKKLCFILPAVILCVGCATHLPKVFQTNEVEYSSDSLDTVKISYFSLSDASLHFVKFFINGDYITTLPQLVSGSGVRYSDGYSYTLWVEGETAFISRLNRNKEWEIYLLLTLIKEDSQIL
ncbi:MAG: MliC family protein [Treponemataceae bacterium]